LHKYIYFTLWLSIFIQFSFISFLFLSFFHVFPLFSPTLSYFFPKRHRPISHPWNFYYALCNLLSRD
jgi:hypothetical protein